MISVETVGSKTNYDIGHYQTTVECVVDYVDFPFCGKGT